MFKRFLILCEIGKSGFVKEYTMSVNIAETLEFLFDKNNKVAYKAFQELQKESQETACVYPYIID